MTKRDSMAGAKEKGTKSEYSAHGQRLSRRSAPRASIELHIQELVLHGFDARDRHRIRDAVERELGRLLAEQGLASAMIGKAEIAALDPGTFSVTPDANPENTGGLIARAIYKGLRTIG